MKTTLTKKESARLIELGLPKEKASEFGIDDYAGSNSIRGGLMVYGDDYPIFTLTDLLEILPKEIESKCLNQYNEETTERFFFCIDYFSEYSVGYRERVTEFWMHIRKNSVELIDALYELCVWCLENKYLKI